MPQLLKYALNHRIPVLGMSLVYAAMAILYHEDAQDLVRLIQREEMWMWGSGVLGMLGIGYWGWRIGNRVSGIGNRVSGIGNRVSGIGNRVSGTRDRGSGIGDWEPGFGALRAPFIWFGLVVVAIVGYLFLMSYPTEVVHYLQFGILGVMLAVAFRRVDTAFVLTVVLGMMDEAYQYWWLHRHWGVYYDFNDVVLNVIAAALGLATVATLWPDIFVEGKITAETQGRREKRISFDAVFVFVFTLTVSFAIGVWTGLIAIQAADVRDHTLLLLNRMKPFETFWETFNGATSQHHVMRAWWGVLLTALMTVGGVKIVELLRWRSS